MELFEAVQRRQSIRKFQPIPIEADQLAQILATANQAPSAGNLQAYQIIVVKDCQGFYTTRALAFFLAESPLLLEEGSNIEEIDIAGAPELEEQFGTSIPVVEIDGIVRFRGRVSELLLRRLIEGTLSDGSPEVST